MKINNMLMFCAVLLFCACSKNDSTPIVDNEQLGKNCKIISTAEDNKPISTYSYDKNGRIFGGTNLIGFGDGVFTYNNSNITFTNSTTGETRSLTLDNAGNITLDRWDKYTYNKDGYLIEKIYRASPDNYHYVLSYDQGNLTKVVIDNFETATMTYYDEDNQNLLGYENAVNSTILFQYGGFPTYEIALLGKASKKRLKSIVKERVLNGVFERFVHTYTYKTDGDGKITSLNIKRIGVGGDIPDINVAFTYQCD